MTKQRISHVERLVVDESATGVILIVNILYTITLCNSFPGSAANADRHCQVVKSSQVLAT
jgi:hypothetical protein